MGSWKQLQIDENGSLRVKDLLDREGPLGMNVTLLIVATDRGSPPLSSTATVRLHLQDVNDCPPTFKSKEPLHIQENSVPQM